MDVSQLLLASWQDVMRLVTKYGEKKCPEKWIQVLTQERTTVLRFIGSKTENRDSPASSLFVSL